MIVLDIPVRKRTVRLAGGAAVELLRLSEGFVRVSGKDVTLDNLHNGQTLISNPLVVAFLNNTEVGTGEDVYIRLVEEPEFDFNSQEGFLTKLQQGVV
jgi:hypothetical protein